MLAHKDSLNKKRGFPDLGLAWVWPKRAEPSRTREIALGPSSARKRCVQSLGPRGFRGARLVHGS